MTAISPALFLTAVTEILRVGNAFWDERKFTLRTKAFSVLLPGVPELAGDQMEANAIELVFRNKEWWAPGSDLDGLFAPDAVAARPAPNASVEKIGLAVSKAADFWRERAGAPPVLAVEGGEPLNTAAVATLKRWTDDEASPRSRWTRLGLTLGRSALTIVATQPSLLGVRGRAELVLGAVAQNLNDLVPDGPITHAPGEDFGERAVKLFVESTLETLVEQPQLVIPQQHLSALATALIKPLKDEVAARETLALPAMSRLRELLRGPMALGALQAIHAHADAFLGDDLGADKAVGAVVRSVLGEFVSTNQQSFDLRRAFSGAGATRVLNAALDTARQRPELFIDGEGNNTDAARAFLRGVATKMREAPRPFQWRDGLGADIAGVALDLGATYLQRRLAAQQGESDWSALGVNVGQHVIEQVFAGFKAGLRSTAYRPFEHFFSRDQAIDVLRIVALHAAETPGMIVGDRANPEVKNIAAAVMRFVADDENRLLRPGDWRAVISVALSEAAKNPGALFSIDADAGPEQSFAVMLVGRVLTQAGANFAGEARRPGAILFGETLREAISITLKAAANSAQSLIEERRAGRAQALEDFVKRLTDLAAGEDDTLRMGASEWLYVYRFFVAHVLDTGRVDEITDEQIRALLRQVNAPRPAPPAPT